MSQRTLLPERINRFTAGFAEGEADRLHHSGRSLDGVDPDVGAGYVAGKCVCRPTRGCDDALSVWTSAVEVSRG